MTLYEPILRLVYYIAVDHQVCFNAVIHCIEIFLDSLPDKTMAHYFVLDGDPVEYSGKAFRGFVDSWRHGECSEYPNATIIVQGTPVDRPLAGLYYGGRKISLARDGALRGFLLLWMPMPINEPAFKDVITLFLKALDILKPETAYAAPGFAVANIREGQALGRRYMGIDISQPETMAFDIGRKVAGVYWLNAIDLSLEIREEDIRFLYQNAKDVRLISWGKYFIIMIGDTPSLLDQNRQVFHENENILAQYFHKHGKLYTDPRLIFFKTPDGQPDREGQLAWHQRFISSGMRRK